MNAYTKPRRYQQRADGCWHRAHNAERTLCNKGIGPHWLFTERRPAELDLEPPAPMCIRCFGERRAAS